MRRRWANAIVAVAALGAARVVVPWGCDAVAGNEPVRFYGVVLEESNRPAAGAVVTMTVVRQKVPLIVIPFFGPGTESIPFERVTATDGRFAVDDVSGSSLTVTRVAPGGEAPGTTDSRPQPEAGEVTFQFRDITGVPKHVPDPDRPVRFHLRRTPR